MSTSAANSLPPAQGVRVVSGVYIRLEDYCANGPGGNGLHYTSGLITMDEELMALELGERVANEAIGLAVEGWGAFMDALYSEYEAEALGSSG